MIIFLSVVLKMCFGCSKEPSHWDGSFEYSQHMIWLRSKKISFRLCMYLKAWYCSVQVRNTTSDRVARGENAVWCSWSKFWFFFLSCCFILLSHLCKYACEWAYECNSAPIRNDHKKFVGVHKHPWGIRNHSRGHAKIRNKLLKFTRKVYFGHIPKRS